MSPDFDIRPVSIESAVAWARGEIHDSKLDTTKAQIVFWNELGSIAAYRPALARIVALWREGCRGMIVHACNPVVWGKLEREGCVCVLMEEIEWRGCRMRARRYVAAPVVWDAWVRKLVAKPPSQR